MDFHPLCISPFCIAIQSFSLPHYNISICAKLHKFQINFRYKSGAGNNAAFLRNYKYLKRRLTQYDQPNLKQNNSKDKTSLIGQVLAHHHCDFEAHLIDVPLLSILQLEIIL